ncbi:unnamed protein product [Discosporangium mesarthrocarpum]
MRTTLDASLHVSLVVAWVGACLKSDAAQAFIAVQPTTGGTLALRSSLASLTYASRPGGIPIQMSCTDGFPSEQSVCSREGFLCSVGSAGLVLASLGGLTSPAAAEDYYDEALGVKFEVPSGWERGEAQISGRRKVVIYSSPKTPGANAFVVYTPVRSDFTNLGSMGTLDEVSKTVLPEGKGVSSRMLESFRAGSSYVYDYIVNQEERPETHIRTAWVLLPDAGLLLTVSAQCNEQDHKNLAPDLSKIVSSLKTERK